MDDHGCFNGVASSVGRPDLGSRSPVHPFAPRPEVGGQHRSGRQIGSDMIQPVSDGLVSGFDEILLVSHGSMLENIERARDFL